MKKQCFKCREEKSISDFYKHPRMADGYLGKCKTCAKRDVAEMIAVKKLDKSWMAKERLRCRIKQRKYRELGIVEKVTTETRNRWREKNMHKISAQQKARRALIGGRLKMPDCCEMCKAKNCKLQMHHPDYSKPIDVQFLCTKCHGLVHQKDFDIIP